MNLINYRRGLLSKEPEDVAKLVRRALASSQSTLNQGPQSFAAITRGGLLPKGLTEGSTGTAPTGDGGITLTTVGTANQQTTLNISAALTLYVALQTGTAAPTTAQFPQEGNFGWYVNTATSDVYWVINRGGSVVGPTIGTFSGNISDSQHGNRGRLVNAAAMHTGATTSEAGFMSSADKTKLDDATNNTVASTLALRTSGGNCNFATVNLVTIGGTAGQLQVDGIKVVGAQGNAVANAVAAAADPPTQTEFNNFVTQFNTLLGRLRTHGLINT